MEYKKIHGAPNVTYSIGACGGNFTTLKGILTTPAYPWNYPNDVDCIYTISQPNGTYISMSILSMDIDCEGTPSDYMEIKDGNSENSPLIAKSCGNGSHFPESIQTSQNHLSIR